MLEDLIYMHWGVSVVVSVIAYVGLAVVLPQYCAGDSCGLALRPLVSVLSTMAPFIALVLLIPAPLSALRAWKERRLLDRQGNLESIRALPLEGFRETPRRVLPATRFQGGRETGKEVRTAESTSG